MLDFFFPYIGTCVPISCSLPVWSPGQGANILFSMTDRHSSKYLRGYNPSSSQKKKVLARDGSLENYFSLIPCLDIILKCQLFKSLNTTIFGPSFLLTPEGHLKTPGREWTLKLLGRLGYLLSPR